MTALPIKLDDARTVDELVATHRDAAARTARLARGRRDGGGTGRVSVFDPPIRADIPVASAPGPKPVRGRLFKRGSAIRAGDVIRI